MFLYSRKHSENLPFVPTVFSLIQVPKIFVQSLAAKSPSRPPFCLSVAVSAQSPFIYDWYGYQASPTKENGGWLQIFLPSLVQIDHVF